MMAQAGATLITLGMKPEGEAGGEATSNQGATEGESEPYL